MAEPEEAKRSESVLGTELQFGEMSSRRTQEERMGLQFSSDEEEGGRGMWDSEVAAGSRSPPPQNRGGADDQGGAEEELDGAPVIRADDEEEEEDDWDMDTSETPDCVVTMATSRQVDTDRRTEVQSDRPASAPSELRTEGSQAGTQTDSTLSLGTASVSRDARRPPVADVEMSAVVESAADRRERDSALSGVANDTPGALCSTQELERETVEGGCFFPPVDIKDEPLDEAYDRALVPQPPPRCIKDEPDTSEEQHKTSEELRISSVFSVGENSTPPTVPAAPPPALALWAGTATPPGAVRVSCSGCTKVLQKGQTAFQRKGSSQLFCSTVCLTGCNLPPAPKAPARKTCHSCLKDIGNPKDVIIAPVDASGTVKDFCSQACLSSFDFKRSGSSAKQPAAETAIKCSMCKKTAVINHEVNYQGAVHKLCSDACFSRFRSSNNLTMNCCETCGTYCYTATGQCHLLQIEGATRKFCSQACLTAYKQKSVKVTPCANCHSLRSAGEMVEGAGPDGKVQLYCSEACAANANGTPPSGIAGASFPCTSCRVVAVPQFHLALNDGSIRNFCSYNCVLSFQASFSKALPLGQAPPMPSARGHGPALPAALPRGPAPAQAPPPVAGGPAPPSSGLVKLTCRQCRRLFSSKPELLQFKGHMVLLCGKICAETYRKLNFTTLRCDYCKLDKTVRDVVKFNHVDHPFCSEGCKLLFKHDLAKRSGNPCRTCAYCANAAQKMIQNHFGGKLEEFCKEECMALYTVLFYQMAKCDWCLRQGKLLESQKWLGEMKHFCDLSCLLLFSNQQTPSKPQQAQSSPFEPQQAQSSPFEPQQAQSSPFEPQQAQSSPFEQQHGPHPGALALPPQIPTGAIPASIAPLPPPAGVPSALPPLPIYASKEATPVIANVVSLASAPTGQPYITVNTALQGAVPTTLTLAKINGDASTQTDAMKLPAPPRRVLKNKALLCKPISQNKGTLCKPHQQHAESQTDEVHGQKILVLPVPVPIFIPVPMHLYSQYTPIPVGLPVPLPVPLFVPPPLDRTESQTQPAQENSPPNPHMAEEEEEEEEERDKPVSYGDQGSTYSGDLESEGVSTPHSWEEEPAASTQRLGATDREGSPATSATPPLVDLEADFPIELLEMESGKGLSVTQRHRGRQRPRDGFPPRKRQRAHYPIWLIATAGIWTNGSAETRQRGEQEAGRLSAGLPPAAPRCFVPILYGSVNHPQRGRAAQLNGPMRGVLRNDRAWFACLS
ncbi:hypothetical protein SKAU_G00421620 [Synaphobranchus kaupii]|uniref:TRASH domain-containing protein n=1 Tax=Synaphobranchus kaupii TaxID=118154 RepID=A0A9Q1E6T1_SYNKA|nr:hypothetical protein SKAU_G00421620 [Synaphobranchus kaupii]